MNFINNTNKTTSMLSPSFHLPEDDNKQLFLETQHTVSDEDFNEWKNGYSRFTKDISPEVHKNTMSDIAGLKERLAKYELMEKDDEQFGQLFKDTYRDNFALQMTPKRNRQLFPKSDNTLNDVFGNSIKEDAKRRLHEKRQYSKKNSKDTYYKYISTLGANPEYAMHNSLSIDKPLSDIENTIYETDMEKLVQYATPLAKARGEKTEDYINKKLIPELYDELLDEVVKEEIPNNSAEYILRSALDNSLVGKISNYAENSITKNNEHSILQDEALHRYDSGRLEDFVAGVGSLLVDAPAFSMLGLGSGAVYAKTASALIKKLAGRIFATKFGEGMTRAAANKIAERALTKRLGYKIMQSATTQGLTLGAYDAMNSVVDDLLVKNDVQLGNAAESFGKGLLTGAALGTVGTPLRESAKGLKGVKKMFANTGVLSAESAVFTTGTEMEKLKHGIEVTPVDLLGDFAESAATLLVMRMAHWRPKGSEFKLDNNGKLKKDFQLSKSEKAELDELNVNADQLIAAIEHELKLPSFGGEKSRFIKNAYVSLMTNDKLSASTKSKLMFLVENKITSTPPIPFDFNVEEKENGKWEISTFDAAGRVVSRKLFDHAGNAKSYFMVNRADIRRNRIIVFETELTKGLRSVNFLRQAGLYAEKKNISIDDVASAIYKQSIGQTVSPAERKIVDDILERASYDEAGVVQSLYNIRRKIEKRYGLEEGSMMLSINEPFYRINDTQNKALDDYEKVVREEVDLLKVGADKRRAVRLLKQGLASDYFGMSNEEVKKREIEDYFNWVAVRDADRIGLTQKSRLVAPIRPIYIPPKDKSGYVWSFGEAKNTEEDIALYKERADVLGNKFGVKLNYIYDERDIARPDADDIKAVMEYNNQIMAEGWTHKGKVFINLPNAKNVEEVEKTVLHEVVAHRGLMGVFGEHLYDFMEDVYKKASPEVLRGINKIKYKYRFADNYTVIEEYLAYLAENVNLTRQEHSLYVRVKDYIKKLLIKYNIYTGNNRQISEKELARIMQRHSEYMQQGTKPQDYIKDVFGDFKSAHFDKNTYYNNSEFLKGIKSQIEQGKLFSSTPRLFKSAKELMYYDYLPAEQQKKIRKRYGYTEEEMQSLLNSEHYKLGDEYENDGLFSYENNATRRFPGSATRYRIPDDLYKGFPEDWLNPEINPAVKGIDPKKQSAVPILKDPFYRSLVANSPTYAYVYEHLRKLPLEEWNRGDHDLWNSLVNMAEGGAVQFVLKDIATDPVFVKNYPELAMVPVTISKDLPIPVMYDKAENKILLDRNIYLHPQSKYYIDDALKSVASDFEKRRNSVSRQVDEFNNRFKKKYEDAVTYAKKIAMMREIIPEFDAEKKIAESYKNEYGFYPEDFLTRFPDMDDYLLHRVTRGMSRLIDERHSPKYISDSEKMIDKKINKHRKFFWGPVEIIMDAVNSENAEGPLRVAGKKDHDGIALPPSGLDLSEKIMYSKYYPLMLERFKMNVPHKDPTGWEEYRLKLNPEAKAEKEKEDRLERERRRLESN